MAFDVFRLRDEVDRYRSYFESFVNINGEWLDGCVREQLERGALWPNAVPQLNPSFEPARTLRGPADANVIAPETARGPDLRLYRHQEEALPHAPADHADVFATAAQ